MLVYAAVAALLVFVLQWLDYQHTVRRLSTDVYVGVVAAVFVALGIWAGSRLVKRRATEFTRNDQAMEYLGISPREYEVLELLAKGHSNAEIADKLFVSGNTIKTHVARLYSKLEVSRRTQAVERARELSLIA